MTSNQHSVLDGISRYWPPEPGTLPCGKHGDYPEMWVCGLCLNELVEQLETAVELDERHVAERDALQEQFEAVSRERDHLTQSRGDEWQAAVDRADSFERQMVRETQNHAAHFHAVVAEKAALQEQLGTVQWQRDEGVALVLAWNARRNDGVLPDEPLSLPEILEQFEAAQAIIAAVRELPEFFEADGRTHSFVPLLDVLDASIPANERDKALDYLKREGKVSDSLNRELRELKEQFQAAQEDAYRQHQTVEGWSLKCERLEKQLEAAEQALVDLHESLFIGSERGLSKEALRSMATFAKKAAIAASNPASEPQS